MLAAKGIQYLEDNTYLLTYMYLDVFLKIDFVMKMQHEIYCVSKQLSYFWQAF